MLVLNPVFCVCQNGLSELLTIIVLCNFAEAVWRLEKFFQLNRSSIPIKSKICCKKIKKSKYQSSQKVTKLSTNTYVSPCIHEVILREQTQTTSFIKDHILWHTTCFLHKTYVCTAMKFWLQMITCTWGYFERAKPIFKMLPVS